MKKYMIFFLLLFFAMGCGSPREQKPALVIGDIQISPEEFEAAYQSFNSLYHGTSSKVNFLDRYISRKLILKEAEKLGLDKDPGFLENVQIFWEQALLKVMLSQKSKEIASTISVSDVEIKNYYEQRKEKNFPGKEFPEVYSQIKWMLLKEKQGKALQDWVDSLRRKTPIQFNEQRLGINTLEK